MGRSSFILFLLLPFSVAAVEPIRERIEYTTSVSQSYDARSIFTNPAALGFQTALNGAQPLSSTSLGVNQNKKEEFSFGFGYGALGLGVESIYLPVGQFTRYSVGLGTAAGPYLYWGTRFSFTKSSNLNLNDILSLDFGAQLRASKYFSLGVLAESINEPTVSGSKLGSRLVVGITLRPIDRFELTADLDTNMDSTFLDTVGYDVNANIKLAKGVFLRGGYHHQREWQVGLQFNFGISSYYTIAQPSRTNRPILVGVQTAFKRYPSSFRPDDTLEVRLSGNLGEEPVYGGLLGSDRPALLTPLRKLDRAANTPETKRVLIRLDGFPLGLAAAQDVHDAIRDLRKKGKEVHVFLGNASFKHYLIASAASHIHMEGAAELRLLGLRSSRYYLKGTLDKIGIEGELFAKGKYKSAPEMFTRKSPSKADEESTRSRLQNLEEALLRNLVRTKRVSKTKWNKILSHGLFSAQEAKKWGLVDEIGSFDALKEKFIVTRSTAEQKENLRLAPRVAVITASGDIMSGGSSLLSLAGRTQITTKKMRRRIEAAVNDPTTRALVVRVSSGGGEVLPSQQIADLLEKAREKMPVVISMGDAAASGGYLISAPATKIFAQDSTLTGSIGVFLGKVNLERLYKKIDLSKEILSYAPHADLYSEHQSLTPAGREILLRRLNQFYDQFVSYVANQRGMNKPAAEKAAQGRVWLGVEAKKQGLVDETGSYLDAIRFAAKRAGLSEGDYEYYIVKEPRGLFDLVGDGAFAKASSAIPPISKELLRKLHWASVVQDSPFLYLADTGVIE